MLDRIRHIDPGFSLEIVPNGTPVEDVVRAKRIVKEAWQILKARDRWDRTYLASAGLPEDAVPCSPSDRIAVRWSMQGALIKASGVPHGQVIAGSPLDIAIAGVWRVASQYVLASGALRERVALNFVNDQWADFRDVQGIFRAACDAFQHWVDSKGGGLEC